MTRSTVQKKLVLSTVNTLCHPTADEVYFRVTEENPKVSRATVYRVLNGFAGEGKLVRVPMHGSADVFDTTLTPHQHIKCIKCQKIADVSFSPEISDLAGFKLTQCSIILEGICPECQKLNYGE